MITIEREGKDCSVDKVNIYDVHDFPYSSFDCRTIVKNKRRSYYEIIATFDIETTSIIYPKDERNDRVKNFGFMYCWQFCLNGVVVMGREWEEYILLTNCIEEQLRKYDESARLVCYVHSLPFEFQFMRNFFNVSEVFAKSKRNVIKCVMNGFIEYRCSYALTNMSLLAFTQKTKGVVHIKESGEEFDYSVRRFSDTVLTTKQLWYCVCDVLGLWEGLQTFLEEDNVATIPLTSTGFVRRDYLEACINDDNHMSMFHKCRLTPHIYGLCKEASRGAISGSNSIYTNTDKMSVNRIISDVRSKDIKSSYPFQMMTKYFPQTPFAITWRTYDSDKFYNTLDNYCCIIIWECTNLRVKNWQAIPYISKSKCRSWGYCRTGNGKVYSASKIEMTCTEIDFKIIENLYDFDKDSVIIHEMYTAGKGMLSRAFRKHLHEMFQIKTDLEEGDVFLYNKFKNKINASFGMLLTDITNPTIKYIPDSTNCWDDSEVLNIQKALAKYYTGKKSFLTYQHGVWVLAHARDELVDGMNIVQSDIVQVDTDSVKHLEDYEEEFNAYNLGIINQAESFDVEPYSYKGSEKHYLGLWENDGYYKRFVTLGAKKYAYDDGEGTDVHITVAGLNKKTAATWLTKNGGLSKFKSGTTVPPKFSGRTTSYYNDIVGIRRQFVDGHEVVYGSNIAVENIVYTFGLTSEWAELVLDGLIDEQEYLEEDGAYE